MDEFAKQNEVLKLHGNRGVNDTGPWNNCISNWIRKFDHQAPSEQQIELQRIMAKQKEKTDYERELGAKFKKLEQQLDNEQLRTLALDKMIVFAERALNISIRKKFEAKN